MLEFVLFLVTLALVLESVDWRRFGGDLWQCGGCGGLKGKL